MSWQGHNREYSCTSLAGTIQQLFVSRLTGSSWAYCCGSVSSSAAHLRSHPFNLEFERGLYEGNRVEWVLFVHTMKEKMYHPNRLSEYQEIFYCTCNQSFKKQTGRSKGQIYLALLNYAEYRNTTSKD